MKNTLIVLALTFAVIASANGYRYLNVPRGKTSLMITRHFIRNAICADSECVNDDLKEQIADCLPEELAALADTSTCDKMPEINRDDTEALIKAVNESCVGTLINLKIIMCSKSVHWHH